MCDNCKDPSCDGKKDVVLALVSGLPMHKWEELDTLHRFESIISMVGGQLKLAVHHMIEKELVLDTNSIQMEFSHIPEQDAMVLAFNCNVTNIDPNAPDDISELDDQDQ